MSKRTYLILIFLALAFVGMKGAEKLIQARNSSAPGPSDMRKVSAGEFLTAAKSAQLREGKIGYCPSVSGLAELTGRFEVEKTAPSVVWRSTARLADADVQMLRENNFLEGDLKLTVLPQRRRGAWDYAAIICTGASETLGWALVLAIAIISAKFIAARTGVFVPKTFVPVRSDVKFTSVAGCDEAKEEVTEIVDFLKSPQRFEKTGGRMPRGVLLVGAPGTGKTMLAKAVAGEANAKFYSLSGSDFVEMYVGVGAARIRSLFKKARENAPSIIFIDELDAVGRQRSGSSTSGGQQEHEHTLNALLVEMDGFASDAAVVVFAATNRPEIMDKALLRPGRFDRQVTIGLPDFIGRREILKVHAAKIKLDATVKLEDVAKATPGFSGADLANLVNEGALHAARHNRTSVLISDFEEARDKISWGRERRRVMTDSDKRIIAVHEAGHALVQVLSADDSMRLHKVTIIPRGQSLGSTQFMPERDLLNYSKEQLLGRIRCLMAGRVAEEIVLQSITSGASSDIQEASRLARQMVLEWGMSEFGFLALVKPDGEPLGSQQSLHEAERCVRDFLAEQYKITTEQVIHHRPALDAIIAALTTDETISGDVVRALISQHAVSAAA
jgi:cell division protease FtsH